MSKRKQIQSLLNTFFRGKQEQESNTTPTTPAAARIKKTRKFQELWKERLTSEYLATWYVFSNAATAVPQSS